MGGVLTAPLAGGISNIASLTGLFAVMALALRACVLLGRPHRLRGGSGPRPRTVAVLQTVLATAAVLVPAAFMGSGPGLELLHPLAVTMLGGLVTLLLVQGLLLPALLLPAPGPHRGEPGWQPPDTRACRAPVPRPGQADRPHRTTVRRAPMSPKHLSVAGLVIGAAAILAGCAAASPGRDTAGPDQAGGRLADPAAPAHASARSSGWAS